MTRGKDFAEASTQFNGIYAQVAFSTGCEHGYQYAVEKACEWMEEKAILGWIEDEEVDKFVEQFRKAMEE